MSDTSSDRQARGDRIALDRFPTCPRCGDLCEPYATICECGCRLRATHLELARLRALRKPRIVPNVGL